MRSEHINQDNDWAMAPPNNPASQLRLGFKKAACQLELARHAAQLETGCRIKRYFNSTRSRWVFYYVMCLAVYDNQLYTTKTLSQMLGISRQAVTTMVNECLQEGWIVPTHRCNKCYKASQTLLEYDEAATDRRVERVMNFRKNTGYARYLRYLELLDQERQIT
tara:strand:- start:382 stop:873 length:492 start_codon:yes stop_codon:yes gene_type:complete